jgi:hypothetical protein
VETDSATKEPSTAYLAGSNAMPSRSTPAVAGFIEPYSCNADARVILGCQPRKDVELTIRATNGSRIQDTVDLLGITRLRLHHSPRRCNLNPLIKSSHKITLADRHPNKR